MAAAPQTGPACEAGVSAAFHPAFWRPGLAPPSGRRLSSRGRRYSDGRHASAHALGQPAYRAGTAGVPVYRVDLNRADHAALLQLPGVGDNLATRIEDCRSTHGLSPCG